MAWTLADAQAKREEILSNLGILKTQFGDRSVEYSDAAKALALIDSEISRLTGSVSRSTLATFRKD